MQDEEEEDGNWVPLEPHHVDASAGAEQSESSSQTHGSKKTTPAGDSSPTNHHHNQVAVIDSSSKRSRTSMETLQRRLETKSKLKMNLVDHPIHVFWKRFFVHLAKELWALDLYLRLGLILIFTGILLKIFLLSTWYLWYPRLVFFTLLAVGSFVYLNASDILQQWDTIAGAFLSPDKLMQTFEELDLSQFRRFSVLVFLIPTALEMRTLSFLSQIKAESGWFFYNIILATIIFSTMMYLFQGKSWRPRDCTYKGLLILYGSSLFVTIVKTDLRRIPVLAAPFFLATGTLLVTYHDDDMEWLSRIVRHALRLTLRDVLASVSEKVGEDEMLQLAILRWIVDYWSYTPSTTENTTSTGSSSETDTSTPSHPNNESNATPSFSGEQDNSASRQTRPQRPSSQRLSHTLQRHEVEWSELLPMLNMATDQMTTEVNEFQSSRDSSSSARSGSSSNAAPGGDHSNGSLNSLKSMLMSLDVDARGKPAVQAYRKAVLAFPPTKETALILSIVRRCPALMTLIWHFLFGSRSTLATVFVIMVPFISLEYFRVGFWMQACHNVSKLRLGEVPSSEHEKSVENQNEVSLLEEANAMTILLSGDNHSNFNPPTLLLVWNNVLGSLKALEVGLTAARCAQTTSVVVDFTYNIASLAQFGFEVSQRGLGHGIAVMAKEMLFMHVAGEANRQGRGNNNMNTKYTGAAMDAVQNGQVVVKNVQALLEDENLDHIVKPVVNVFCALSGYGWLWGDQKESSDSTDREVSVKSEDTTQFDLIEADPIAEPDQKDEIGSVKIEKPENEDLIVLMEAIATAYENGTIDKTKKDGFCIRLANSPKNVEKKVINEIRKELDVLTNTYISEKVVEEDHEKSAAQDLKIQMDDKAEELPIVDLIAEAYTQGSITESEKNSFLEQLNNLSESQRQDPSVIGGMERTLEALIESESGNEGSSVWKSMKSTGCEAPKDSDENASDAIRAREVAVGHGENSSATMEPPSHTAQAQEDKRSDGDSWMKFGMAVLGVVVGGVVLSMQGGDAGNERNSSEQASGERRNTSSVVIEELSDDVEDEWVAVPSDNQE